MPSRWAVTANIPGKGPAFGEMTVTADAAPDTFVTKTTMTVAKTGETVRIEETRPLSKLKTWKVIERVTASKGTAVEADV